MNSMASRIRSLVAAPLLVAGACLASCAPTQPEPAPVVRTVEFTVEGMGCDGCVRAITDAVLEVPGVTSCQVSLEGHSATVEITDDAAVPAIIERVSAKNYEIAPRPASAESGSTG